MGDVRQTWAWTLLVRWAKQHLPWVCHLCGEPIPNHVHNHHPRAYQLDHVLTVRSHPELALSRDNVAPSHRQCNAWRKDRALTEGLRVEARERFMPRKPAALGFFDQQETN